MNLDSTQKKIEALLNASQKPNSNNFRKHLKTLMEILAEKENLFDLENNDKKYTATRLAEINKNQSKQVLNQKPSLIENSLSVKRSKFAKPTRMSSFASVNNNEKSSGSNDSNKVVSSETINPIKIVTHTKIINYSNQAKVQFIEKNFPERNLQGQSQRDKINVKLRTMQNIQKMQNMATVFAEKQSADDSSHFKSPNMDNNLEVTSDIRTNVWELSQLLPKAGYAFDKLVICHVKQKISAMMMDPKLKTVYNEINFWGQILTKSKPYYVITAFNKKIITDINEVDFLVSQDTLNWTTLPKITHKNIQQSR